MKKWIVVCILLFVSFSGCVAYSFDFERFKHDREVCAKYKRTASCYNNLIPIYFENKSAVNILYADIAEVYINEKHYKEALIQYEYILQNEKNNRELIDFAKNRKSYIQELLKKVETAKKNDVGDYYNAYNSARWKNPENLKVFISNNYEKKFFLRQAFKIWETGLDGLFHFNYVTNPDDADIICEIVPNSGKNLAGVTNTNIVMLNGKKYILHADIKLSFKDNNGKPYTDNMILSTALHEIGHALGLINNYHSKNHNDIMYHDTSNYRGTTLSQRDINTINKIYGK